MDSVGDSLSQMLLAPIDTGVKSSVLAYVPTIHVLNKDHVISIVPLCSIARVRGGAGVRMRYVGVQPT
jgi:hypothetical protein